MAVCDGPAEYLPGLSITGGGTHPPQNVNNAIDGSMNTLSRYPPFAAWWGNPQFVNTWWEIVVPAGKLISRIEWSRGEGDGAGSHFTEEPAGSSYGSSIYYFALPGHPFGAHFIEYDPPVAGPMTLRFEQSYTYTGGASYRAEVGLVEVAVFACDPAPGPPPPVLEPPEIIEPAFPVVRGTSWVDPE